jgi:glycosyltransferase involved in cell wall biosynthesis
MSGLVAITPARNEERLLPGLIASLAVQTRPPDHWIVVDDCSADDTLKILNDAASRYRRIEPHHLPRNRARAAGGESVIMEFLPRQHWGEWDYLLRLEADITFAPDFIALLFAEFRRDDRLGIIGPILLESHGAQWFEVDVPLFQVRGAAKMYSGKCFAEIGGLQAGLGWDSVDELHAMMLGFHCRHFREIRAYHHRRQGTGWSLWRARLAAGRAAYHSGYSTAFMFLRAARHP